jgi:hypothetical protein
MGAGRDARVSIAPARAVHIRSSNAWLLRDASRFGMPESSIASSIGPPTTG